MAFRGVRKGKTMMQETTASTRTVLLTGATSGLGRAVADALARTDRARLILPVREARAGARLRKALLARGARRVDVPCADLARLDDVAALGEAIGEALDGAPVDAVLFNAGTQSSGRLRRSPDGIELTAAVNHLAHHALLRAIEPRLAADAIVVWTASGTHDPEDAVARRFGFRGGRWHGAEALFAGDYPDADDDGQRCRDAYATSKLCNVLSARWAAREAGVGADRRFLAFDPGLMPGTGLAREAPAPVRLAWHRLMPALARAVPGWSSPARSGATLARLALGDARRHPNGANVDWLGKARRVHVPPDEASAAAELVGASDALLARRDIGPLGRATRGAA